MSIEHDCKFMQCGVIFLPGKQPSPDFRIFNIQVPTLVLSIVLIQVDRDAVREKKHIKTQDEWEQVLRHVLLGESSADTTIDQSAPLARLEMVANVTTHNLVLVVRRNVAGVTQRLGTLTLSKDPQAALDTLDWTHCAVKRGAKLESQVADLESRLTKQQHTVVQLEDQLKRSEATKEEDEEILMTKFLVLLNNKKLKIRDQQRLLSTVKVDRTMATQVRQARAVDSKPRPASNLREAKRKAGKREASDSEDAAFDPIHASPKDEHSTQSDSSDHEVNLQPSSSKADARDSEKAQLKPPPPQRRLPFDTEKQQIASVVVESRTSNAEAAPDSGSESDDEL